MYDDNSADFRFGASISSEKVMSRSVLAWEDTHVRLMVPFGYCRVDLGSFGGGILEVGNSIDGADSGATFDSDCDRGDLVLVRRERGGGEIASLPLLRLSRARRSASICLRSRPAMPDAAAWGCCEDAL